MSIKKNTLDTITPNKAKRIYRKELAGMSRIWQESSWGSVSRGRGVLQQAYKPESKALGSLPPGASPCQQIGKINTCLERIRPGQSREENPSFFLTILAGPPSHFSPVPLTSSSGSCHRAWDSIYKARLRGWASPSPLDPLKDAEMPGMGYIMALRPWNEFACQIPSVWNNMWYGGRIWEERKREKGPTGENREQQGRWTKGNSWSGFKFSTPHLLWKQGQKPGQVKWTLMLRPHILICKMGVGSRVWETQCFRWWSFAHNRNLSSYFKQKAEIYYQG